MTYGSLTGDGPRLGAWHLAARDQAMPAPALAQELMRRAEAALDRAKREGRNRFCTQGDGGEGVIGPQDGAAHLN